MGDTGDEDVFELISADHGMVVEDGSGSHIPAQDIISDVVESLLPGLVLVHVERVIDLSGEYALSPRLDRIDGGRKVLYLGLTQQPLTAYLVVPKALSNTC